MPDYLYGLVPAGGAAPTARGIEDRPVLICSLGEGLAVLHSDIDYTRIQPRRAYLTAHNQVLAAAVATGAVLPLRFGTIVEDGPSAVLERLDRAVVAERLHRLNGKVQVQVLWEPDEDNALRRTVQRHPQVRDSSRAAIDRGRFIVETLTELAIQDLTALIEGLQELIVTTGPVEAVGRSARVATLVESDCLEAFLEACEAVSEQVESAGTLRAVGGLPPYSFSGLDPDPLES